MLLNIFSRLFRLGGLSRSSVFDFESQKARADHLRSLGKLHEAIEIYRECVEHDKYNVDVLNSLGVCLDDVGDEDGAQECFEIAYSIDDTYIAGVVNYAKNLADKKETARSLALLEYVSVCEPNYNHILPIYASILFAQGDPKGATHFYRKGWLGSFDSLRMANAYLFALAYSESEQSVAAEHRFWAETLRREDLSAASADSGDGEVARAILPLSTSDYRGRKLRIGYWSPDMRGHSVSYFFRPLLENHDRSRYEIYLYHDSFRKDSTTEAVMAKCDHFHDVYLLNDVQLYELMRSHQLDILVEMAGHTSTNRLMLFKDNRFATLQISGIGYPPTTGISAIDAKILDRYVFTDRAPNYYAEKPLVLPSSFWCFDPMGGDEGVAVGSLPADLNGYVTFACVGNISKITENVMDLWVRIMDKVPSSRLLIRSVSFEDRLSQEAMERRMREAGLDMARVDFKAAVGGAAFFESYNEIDVILDTFPFNGGTTTCFATYMGVPVITRAGDSLTSRMGLSVMANLGGLDWVASDDASYVAKAIEAANDLHFLRDFRARARECFRSSPLGNGRLFAADFEMACEGMLKARNEGAEQYRHTIPALPADELMRRTYAVWRSGNSDAAARVLAHCLDNYPNHGGAHQFVAIQKSLMGDISGAIDYLVRRVNTFDLVDQVAAMISIIRWFLLLNDRLHANNWIKQALSLNAGDTFDAMQLRLYQACLSNESETPEASREPVNGQKVVVLIPCDDAEYFQAMEVRLRSLCHVPEGCAVSYNRCDEQTRMDQYVKWLDPEVADVLIIMQRVVEIVNPNFYFDLLGALNDYDVVGVAGATRWARANWRGDQFEVKTAGFMTESAELEGGLELQCLGLSEGVLVGGQVVLDGVMLALRSHANLPALEPELALLNWALEEDWSHELGKAGMSLAVHRNLGVLVHGVPAKDRRLGYPGLHFLQEKHNFALFSPGQDDEMIISVPVNDACEGLRVMRHFCSASQSLS